MMQPIETNILEQNSPSQPKTKKKVKKIIKRKPKVTCPHDPPKSTEVEYRTEADFQTLDELSAIVRDINKDPGKICLTKKEKKCLEEITRLATKTTAPLDDRLLHLYKQDMNKFHVPINLPEESVEERELADAIAVTKEPPGEITATQNLNTYLTSLKNLIARREIAWAAAQDCEYHQKGEISRLNNLVSHLRVVRSRHEATIKEKDALINSLNKRVKELQKEILRLAKNNGVFPEAEGTSDAKDSKPILKPPGAHVRRNFGPAALLANALHNARNAGK